MRDLLLQSAGILAIVVSLVHGVLGETKVFANVTIEPRRYRRLIHLVWHAGTVAWICGGVLMLAAPSLLSEAARHWIVVVIGIMFAAAVAGNAWATRGRHFGWMLFAIVIALAAAGY